jgi:Mn2+/Fe2+ NRAMP family transporter
MTLDGIVVVVDPVVVVVAIVDVVDGIVVPLVVVVLVVVIVVVVVSSSPMWHSQSLQQYKFTPQTSPGHNPLQSPPMHVGRQKQQHSSPHGS